MSRLAESLVDKHGRYPGEPGWKEPTTSRDAARAIRAGAAVLRERVLRMIASAGGRGMTPDEAAAALELSVLSVRPRVTELAKADPPRIVPTGQRRANESGMKAKVWRSA